MSDFIKHLLVLALPASGKSEARKYMASLSPEQCRETFHIGPTVQLDDYPYVEFMREVDEVTDKILHLGCIFFEDHDRSFADEHEWGTLVELLNEDYADLVAQKDTTSDHPALDLFARIDAAQQRAGAKIKLGRLPQDVLDVMDVQLDKAARKVNDHKVALCKAGLKADETLVIEFARGGPEGPMPLDPPFGYAYCVSRLSPQILREAAVLNVWVDPEESRRKNFARAVPPPGVDDTSIYHGVPLCVMLDDYGCDDMEWLLETSGKPDHIRIDAHGETFMLRTARFDNRDDKTTFVREEPWDDADVKTIHDELKRAMDLLIGE
ncbi:MAG: hypothetical protein P1V51_07740 [Deltaproteobacteria bacterium]|nr:hypothetical protein [Deltaproteobacteria bacterium]